MAYILERYARPADRQELFQELWRQSRELEQRLFSYLPFPPEIISEILGNRTNTGDDP
jgi:hypothetical protein